MSGRIKRGSRPEVITARGKRVLVERRALQPMIDRSAASHRGGKLKRAPAYDAGAKLDMPLAADVARLLQGTPLRFPVQLWGDVL